MSGSGPKIIVLLSAVFLTFSCGKAVNNSIPELATPTILSEAPTSETFSCEDIETNWGSNWRGVIDALDYLIEMGQSCGEEPLLSKKYAAHFNYGSYLEFVGEDGVAVEQYTAAFTIDPNRTEALDALFRMDALPEPTEVPCESEALPLPDPSPAQAPDLSKFVQVQGDGFVLNTIPYYIKGVNYYPRQAPWHRFLSEGKIDEIALELDLIKEAGFNTIRIFLWYEPLFICRPEDAIPNEVTFEKLDTIFEIAKERDLHLIVTLNDLPDLLFRPLYTDWERYDAQTTYIVRRYQNEPAILAWDLRNEGDLDYGARFGDEAQFEQDVVVNWLAHTSNLVQQVDPYHLMTAGWWGDPTVTEPHVDFLSFHHWYDADSLADRIESYVQESDKPLLLGEIGYHSWADAPQDRRDEATQAALLEEAVQTAESAAIAGWVIWTAFDFVPDPGQSPNFEHYFGLWRTDLSTKPALSHIFGLDEN